MNQITARFRWSLKLMLGMLCAMACLVGVLRVLRPETPKTGISGTVIRKPTDEVGGRIEAYDWFLLRGRGAKGALLIVRPLRGSQTPRSYRSLGDYYQFKEGGIVLGGETVLIPNFGSRVFIDETSETSKILEVLPKTDRELSALRAVHNRRPTYEDLHYLSRSRRKCER